VSDRLLVSLNSISTELDDKLSFYSGHKKGR
jgi:hypothetical protein